VTWRAALERQRSLLDFALLALWRRRGKNLSLVLVYGLTVFAIASVVLLAGALRAEAAAVLAGGPDVVVQQLSAGRPALVAAEAVARLGAIRGVSRAAGRRWAAYADPVSHATFTVLAPEGFEGRPGEVELGAGAAAAMRWKPGEKVGLLGEDGRWHFLEVRRLLGEETALVSTDLVLLAGEDFERLFALPPDRFTDVALTVRNPRELTTVARAAVGALPGGRAVTRPEMARTYEALFDWRSGLASVVLLGAVLTFALVAWDKAAGLPADERRELGVLKAIGWETGDVLAAKLWEGVVISVAAFLLGVLAAYLQLFLAPAPLLAPVLRGWSVLSPPLRLAPSVSPLELATLFFLTVVPYTLATVVPVWRAASTDPDAVMRS